MSPYQCCIIWHSAYCQSPDTHLTVFFTPNRGLSWSWGRAEWYLHKLFKIITKKYANFMYHVFQKLYKLDSDCTSFCFNCACSRWKWFNLAQGDRVSHFIEFELPPNCQWPLWVLKHKSQKIRSALSALCYYWFALSRLGSWSYVWDVFRVLPTPHCPPK